MSIIIDYIVDVCNSVPQLFAIHLLLTNILVNVDLNNTVPIEKNTEDFLKPSVTFNVSYYLQMYHMYMYFH